MSIGNKPIEYQEWKEPGYAFSFSPMAQIQVSCSLILALLTLLVISTVLRKEEYPITNWVFSKIGNIIIQCRSSPMPPPPHTFSFTRRRKKSAIFFVISTSFKNLWIIDFSRNITKSLTLILKFVMKSALYSGLLDKLYLYVFFDNYFVPFALYFRKIIKISKEYQRFWDPGSVFSGHVQTKILKFSPASATKVRLPGRGGREGRGGEGRGEKGRGRGRRDGVFLKCVTTAL